MKTNMLNRISIMIGIAGLLAFLGAGWLYVETQKAEVLVTTANAAYDDKADHDPEVHPQTDRLRTESEKKKKPDAHDHGTETSDLDRPIEDLWAARCEHDVFQYECDECRYEIGVAKLPSEIITGKSADGFVRTEQTRRMPFSEERVLSGELGISEEKTSTVTSPLTGTVKAVYVKAGEQVKIRAPLFDIDSREVSEGKAAYAKALATLDLARKNAARETTLFDKKISARMDVEKAKASLAEAEVEVAGARAGLVRLGIGGDVLSTLGKGGADFSGLVTIRSPGDGIVMEKHTVVGEFVEVGKTIFRISDISEVWAWANLKEGDLTALQNLKGNVSADVSLPDGKKQRGRLDLVSKTMDEHTRTVRARIPLTNPDGELRPGMFVQIRLLIPGVGEAVAIPKTSVLEDEGRFFVFTHKEKEFWIRRPVVIGREVGGLIEVLEGLTTDQTILADGAFVAKSDVLRAKMGAGCAD